MISKTHRFSGRGGISHVYRKGRTFRAPYTSIRFIDTNNPKGYHLSIVVSKKIDKRAVVRNRIRRRLYEEFRRQLKGKEALKKDMVVTVFAVQLATSQSEEITNIVSSLISSTR